MPDDDDQRLTSLNEARDVFLRALKNHEHFVYRLGYEAGFAAGWEALVRRLSTAKPDEAAVPPHGDLSDLMQQHESEIPARDTLIAIIKQAPGLQRHEVVEIARKSLSHLTERTVRTALQRLKEAGELRVEDNRWYVAVKAPAPRLMPAGDFDE
jgi:hypothetical protein